MKVSEHQMGWLRRAAFHPEGQLVGPESGNARWETAQALVEKGLASLEVEEETFTHDHLPTQTLPVHKWFITEAGRELVTS